MLVRAALADYKARGFRLAQAVLDKSGSANAAHDLTRGGLPWVTDLLYLERDTTVPLFPSAGSARGTIPGSKDSYHKLEWRAFGTVSETEFRSVLEETYVGSMDMPELEGTRTLDDVLESHRASGRFMAERWRLGRVPGKSTAAAVLLLTEAPGRDVWEVIYLGLTPAARGYGLGRAVLQHALELAQGHVSRLALAVDHRNTPATRLYHSAGFVARDRRAVHLAVLQVPSG
jgi:ribosomal protein S18 acetylase RimI-like enzyme